MKARLPRAGGRTRNWYLYNNRESHPLRTAHRKPYRIRCQPNCYKKRQSRLPLQGEEWCQSLSQCYYYVLQRYADGTSLTNTILSDYDIFIASDSYTITLFFLNIDLNSLGVTPRLALKILLKLEMLLNPHSKHISDMFFVESTSILAAKPSLMSRI